MFKNKFIKSSKPKCCWKVNSVLGEGVLWVPNLNSVFFVDIKKKKIFCFNIKLNKKKIIKLDKEIGFLSHVKNNIFILGLKSELRFCDLTNLKIYRSIKVEPNRSNNRINDGIVDPAKRLWFSTMDNFEKKISGSLYCLDRNLKLHTIEKGYFIGNGPTFINRNNFFHTDSRKKTIYKIRINKKLKIIKKVQFIKFNEGNDSPDGMALDINNNLWVCHYRGGKISVYNMKAEKIFQIKLPVKNITKCSFGGPKMNELFITTARKGMSKKEIIKLPFSGSLFRVKINLKGKSIKSFNSDMLNC